MKLPEGSITYRKSDSRYMGRYRDSDGRCRCVYASTYAECLNKLKESLAYRDRYLSNIKFYDWLEDWFKNFKAPNLKPASLDCIEVAIRCHIKKGLPNKLLVEINGLELQRFLIGVANTRTRENIYMVLNESFKTAFALRFIDFNPMLAVKIPKHKRKKGSALSDYELQEFFKRISGSPIQSYFLFCLFTGARRSEALAVKWSDIDFKNRFIHLSGTKTETSDRFIPLFTSVETLLSDLPRTSERIFNYNPDYVTHTFKKYCPNHKLHDLRHTFATKCMEASIPLKVIQVWLGHSAIEITADIYSHVQKDYSMHESCKIDSYFSSMALNGKFK